MELRRHYSPGLEAPGRQRPYFGDTQGLLFCRGQSSSILQSSNIEGYEKESGKVSDEAEVLSDQTIQTQLVSGYVNGSSPMYRPDCG